MNRRHLLLGLLSAPFARPLARYLKVAEPVIEVTHDLPRCELARPPLFIFSGYVTAEQLNRDARETFVTIEETNACYLEVDDDAR